mgnify:CR=1 FL=1
MIQLLVRKRDLRRLFDLVEGELLVGPRKAFVQSRVFKEAFSEEWRQKVVESETFCRPVGWRGFMLANRQSFVYSISKRQKCVQSHYRLATIRPLVAPDRVTPTVIGKLERVLSRLASANADSLA